MKNAFSYNAIPKTAMLPMAELANMIYSFRDELESTPLDTLLEMVIKRTGYEKMLIEEGESGKERRENLEQLITAIKEYEAENEDASLTGFLEQIALVADVDKYDENDDTVILMTIHSAKGLEFPIVFIPGMEECIFPSQQTIMFPSEIEEERRLAYVAITRAKKALYMVHAKERMMHGMTMHNPLSRFVKEIDPSFLDIQKVAISRGSFTMPQSKGTISFTEALTGSKNAEKKPATTPATKPATSTTTQSAASTAKPAAKKYKKGDIVNFKGSKHYISSNSSLGSKCKPGQAKITNVKEGAKHPYHLVRVSGKGSTVYGWVNVSDIG
jgi:DNA helicase-2/ATP-dependent DNA helicase PcrA